MKQEEDGGLGAYPQKKFLGLRPLEHRKRPFLIMGGYCYPELINSLKETDAITWKEIASMLC